MKHLVDLLATALTARGWPSDATQRLAREVLDVALAAGVVSRSSLDQWERDAQIYHLRSHGLSAAVIGVRINLRRSQVFEAVRRHTKRRRAALKLVS